MENNINDSVHKFIEDIINEIKEKSFLIDVDELCELCDLTYDEFVMYIDEPTSDMSLYINIIEKINYLIERGENNA